VNLGPQYHYDAQGNKVFQNQPGTQQPAARGGVTDVLYGTSAPSGNYVGQTNSAANYPFENPKSSTFGWAKPYNSQVGLTGAGGGRATTRTATLTRTILPKGTTLPSFTGPTWDEGEIKKRAQKNAAPARLQLQQQVQNAMARYYENPNVRRMVLRDTLSGYGIGLANILTQSENAGRASYTADYSRQFAEASAAYQRAWSQTMLQATQVASQVPIYTAQGFEELMTGKSPYTQKA
jgi:hypothetical protein